MRWVLTLGAILAALTTAPAVQPAHAAADGPADLSREASIHSEVSAQKRPNKRKVSTHRHRYGYARYPAYYGDPTRSPYYLRPGVAPSFGYVGPPGYAGEFAWRRSIGQCVEDLGYGRWAACGSR